jgi:hypothetical protein
MSDTAGTPAPPGRGRRTRGKGRVETLKAPGDLAARSEGAGPDPAPAQLLGEFSCGGLVVCQTQDPHPVLGRLGHRELASKTHMREVGAPQLG